MKAATVKELKEALSERSPKQLTEICLRLSKFKKENKELLTYLLFESANEEDYIQSVKRTINHQFEQINTSRYYFVKKSVRKILREVKKYIRYSQNKETEVELLLHFCRQLKAISPSYTRYRVLQGLYQRQIDTIKKKVLSLHEDLQYDYEQELEELQ